MGERDTGPRTTRGMCIDPEVELFEPVDIGLDDEEEMVETFDDLTPEQQASAERAAATFNAECAAIEKVERSRGLEFVALQNAEFAYENVNRYRAQLEKDLPAARWDLIDAIPALALAFVFASARAERAASAVRRSTELMPRVWELRRMLLAAVHCAVLAGFIKPEDEALIRQGRGNVDAVKDLIALLGLFDDKPEVFDNRTFITAEQLAEARTLAEEMPRLMELVDGHPLASPHENEVDRRDRLWTLLGQYYKELLRVGTWQWGPEVTRYVRPLLSRPMKKNATKAAEQKADQKDEQKAEATPTKPEAAES